MSTLNFVTEVSIIKVVLKMKKVAFSSFGMAAITTKKYWKKLTDFLFFFLLFLAQKEVHFKKSLFK